MPRSPMPDVIVLLPGILGSALEKNGKELWGLSAGAGLRALVSLGANIQNLKLHQEPNQALDVWEGVTAPRLLPDLHMVPGLWKIDGYTKIAANIKKIFDVTPGQNYFEFPYDWRLSNRITALRLERMAKEWVMRWRNCGHPNGRLILIGHSMGGLIARYFLEVLGGWGMTRTLITFGTPHRGSLNALDFIVNGWRKKFLGVEILNLTSLLRSFSSVYELLPIYPCCVNDGKMKYLGEVNIPELDVNRLASAKAFHDAIREGVKVRGNSFDQHVHPVVGTLQPTLQSARFKDGVVEMFNDFEGDDHGGDGTVPRVSATPIELSEAGRDMFAAERHASLQNNDAVWTQVQAILETGQIKLGAFKVPQLRLSMQLKDAYSVDESLQIRARADALETPPLWAEITSIEDGNKRMVALEPAPDGWQETENLRVPAGTYRTTIYGDVKVIPVTDIFIVT